ncbi:deoxyribodipyrimidine photo-lyase [Thioalkalivibrio sp. ALE19]|uniref:cryptochrome/photolyase family protein n=1 Tax=Thioalkalivibrio sp. ALE19 TaxID=1266909 RepID=UPI00041703A2|nr:deoxyribodipyrimidine photo-lyase [Thioalkalivibrio sp. ALE19]
MSTPFPALVWLRRDLRLADQPALHAALSRGGSVIPVYIHAPDEEAPWAPGAASRWWLHHSLQALAGELEALGATLTLRRGSSLEQLHALVRETGAGAVYWNRLYEPAITARDATIKAALREDGLEVHSFAAALLHEPRELATGQGTPYRVFTSYWRAACKRGLEGDPLPAPSRIPSPPSPPASDPLEALELLPRIRWDSGLAAAWNPGERAALERLQGFIEDGVGAYTERRERPDTDGTSRLSPHLHFGEISPTQILRALRQAGLEPTDGPAEPFVRELGWRDFAHHVLYHFPHTPEQPLNPRFEAFPWRESAQDLERWQQGRTGIPVIDAAMRQLWETGWMHNRMRMAVGSFLTKNLHLHWHAGARWFWDTLVDADLAANTLGWQWAAGCGADAAPYFRVFNPQRQGERFDPDAAYIRRFVPELARAPARDIHQLRPGLAADYPAPMVDLKQSRQAALDAFATIKNPPRSDHG